MPRAPIDRLSTLVGASHVLTGVDCSPFAVDGRTPEAVVLPGSKEEVAAVLAVAGEAEIPVTPWGGGTKMGIGSPPARPGLVLSLRRLDRLLEHEPGDLTATAQAGMGLTAFQAALGARGQWLSLDPPYADRATLGGILATSAAGPRRHLYGTARDLLIGLTLVLADGAVVRGGGKVVKNVAGYDLPKLAIGSFGTLGVIVDATFKLRPRPEADRLAVIGFERLKDAGQAARAVMGSDLIPSAVELLDREALGALGGAGWWSRRTAGPCSWALTARPSRSSGSARSSRASSAVSARWPRARSTAPSGTRHGECWPGWRAAPFRGPPR